LSLRIFPDEVLRKICDPVNKFDTELSELIKKMFVLMRINDGIGLAASQVGITKCLFVCEIEQEKLSLINPCIIHTSGRAEMIEGCLSLPDTQVNVTRCNQLVLQGFDECGREMRCEFKGLWARVIQHEMDHLTGVLICDYGKNLQNEKAQNDRYQGMNL